MFNGLRIPRRAANVKHVCRDCETRRALFRYRGVVKWDRYHTLCFQCHRKYSNRQRALAAAAETPARSAGTPPTPWSIAV